MAGNYNSRISLPYKISGRWTYNKVSRAKSINYNGIMGSYHGGGFAVNFAKNGNNTKELFNQLEEDHWINRNTRIVFVAFSLYNPNLNIFAICKLIFELPPTGGIFSNYKFTTVKLVPDEDVYQFFVMICEYVFYAFIVFYFLQIIWELIYFKLRFFKHFWSYVDILITILAVTTLILSIIQRGSVKPTIDAIKKKPNEYGNLEYLGDIQAFHNDLCAVMIFLIYIRLFKYLNFNRTMSQLSDTIKKCSMDVLGFSFMFLIVFLAYAELGFLLFGSKVEEFRNLGVSMFTLLRTVLGDFNYPDIEHANANMAPVYFLSYIFLVFFVLLNMFLAIINDTYADVKTEIAIAPTELQMTGYLMRQVKKLLRKCGCKLKADAVAEIEYNETADQIRTALKKCGFTFLEIEMFFSRFNIDPLSSVDENELNKLLAKIQAGGTLSPTDNISEGNYVKVTDFQEQKKQLKLMENTIVSIEKSVDTLLKKIEALK